MNRNAADRLLSPCQSHALGVRMLKKVQDARFHLLEHKALGFVTKLFMGTGSLKAAREKTGTAYYRFSIAGDEISVENYQSMFRRQQEQPVLVYSNGATQWWWFRNEFYWDNEGHPADDVRVLVLDEIQRKEKKIQRARARVEGRANSGSRREQIPDEVRMFVWQRDQGRCVKFGSQENLEFDHIIPVGKGGSNTARNLQLLCEHCNNEKGGNIV